MSRVSVSLEPGSEFAVRPTEGQALAYGWPITHVWDPGTATPIHLSEAVKQACIHGARHSLLEFRMCKEAALNLSHVLLEGDPLKWRGVPVVIDDSVDGVVLRAWGE